MTRYRITKQLYKAPKPGDPVWAMRNVFVAMLNENDTIFEYDSLEEAETKKSELEESESDRRINILEV
jgi:hypothetical protein|tara:strand:- start:1397 stop:1600 length:204 start_codon:yes stop_codon:yes gene_type:complete